MSMELVCDVRVGCVAVYEGPRENCIADVPASRMIFHRTGYLEGSFWTVDPEDVKKASLMAAAPELYEALKAAREELRLLRMKDTATVYDPTLNAKIVMALAKAEGRA